MQTKITTLPNGLRIITNERKQLESVSLGIWINTGAAYEPKDTNCISHFVEPTVFQGTKSRSALQIAEEIEDVGGQNNAYTGREITAYYAKMLKNDAELALDILAELVTCPQFPKDEIAREQDVVIQEIKQTNDSPEEVIFDYFQEKAFSGQPVGRSILGTQENIRSFDAAALRNYMKTHYAADNTVVCAVGNIDHDAFVKMVEKRLSAYQPKSSFVKPEQKYTGGFICEKRDIEQLHLIFGFEGAAYDNKKYYPLMLFSTLFGGGMSSRLFQEVREKLGLVYTIYNFTHSLTHSGITGIYAGTTHDQLEKLLPVIGTEVRKIRNDLVDIKELNRAKAQLKASMLMALESSSSSTEVLARQMIFFNHTIPIQETVEKIENVTLNDIRDAANRVFSSKLTYAALGAYKSIPDYDEVERLFHV